MNRSSRETNYGTSRTSSLRLTRSAFTLIEIMVVFLVIALLAGFLIPAVQSSRETSRRVYCASNLRQIGLALQGYESVHRMYTPGQLKTGPTWTANRMSGLAFLLPFLEQEVLYSSINMNFVHIESPDYPTLDNRTARMTRVGTFLCPSDGEPNHLNSYRFNRGRFGMKPGYPFDGPFSLGVLPTVAAISDGLANTAFLSERVGGSFFPSAEDEVRDIKKPAMDGMQKIVSDAQFIPECISRPASSWNHVSGRYWMFTGTDQTDYNHNGRPNDPRPSCTGSLDFGLHPPRSFHPNSVHILFGDGHVMAVPDSISTTTWTSLGTHDMND